MDREAAKKKIAALLKMTERSGCTEAEALAAAEKAATLMREYQLSEEEAETTVKTAKVSSQGHSARDDLWAIVAFCTNTVPVVEVELANNQIAYIGQEPGPEIATYLHVLLDRAISAELRSFKESVFYRRRRTLSTRRAASRDFVLGLVHRLSRRLVDLFETSIDREAHEKALVARDNLYGELSAVADRKRPGVTYGEAASSGWQAGGKVNLAHGVSGGRPAAKLEAKV